MNFNSIARYTNDVMTPHGSRGLSLTQRAGGRNKYTAMDMIQGSQTLNPDLQAQNNFEQMRSQYAMAGQSQLFDESGLSPMLSGSRPASNSVSGIHRRGFTKSSTQLKEAVSALKTRATSSPLLHPQITELLVALNDTVMGPEIVKMYQTSNKPLEDVIKEVIRHYKGLGTGPSSAIRSSPALPTRFSPMFIGSSSSGGPSSAPAMIKGGAAATGISGAKGRGGRKGRIGGRGGSGRGRGGRGGKDMSIKDLFALSAS